MRGALERRLNAIWYGERTPDFGLRALESLYAPLARARSWWLGHTVEQSLVGKPIVVVGNITAGGTGKTPLIIRLCQLLQAAGLKPGVVTRGYGRRGRAPLSVGAGQGAETVGDEPLLIWRRCRVPVRVDRARERAARRLLSEGVDVVLCDDGLQRARLPRELEICVVDATRGLGNRRLLPAGPLREPAGRLQEVDAVIGNGGALAGFESLPHAAMVLEPGGCLEVAGTGQMDLGQLRGMAQRLTVHALAAIAHPQRFFDMLHDLGIVHRPHAFPDHHRFTRSDLPATGDQSMLLMTEKDAVKCERLALGNAWYIPVDARLPADWERWFLARVQAMHTQVS